MRFAEIEGRRTHASPVRLQCAGIYYVGRAVKQQVGESPAARRPYQRRCRVDAKPRPWCRFEYRQGARTIVGVQEGGCEISREPEHIPSRIPRRQLGISSAFAALPNHEVTIIIARTHVSRTAEPKNDVTAPVTMASATPRQTVLTCSADTVTTGLPPRSTGSGGEQTKKGRSNLRNWSANS